MELSGIATKWRRISWGRKLMTISVATLFATTAAVPLASSVASATSSDGGGKVTNITGTIDASSKYSATCTSEQSSTGLAKDLLDQDLWHFLVQQDSIDYTRRETKKVRGVDTIVDVTYTGTLSADFTVAGSNVEIELENGNKQVLTAGAANNQANHIYVFTPAGTKIKNAWLKYGVVFAKDSKDNNAGNPTVTIPNYLTSNHNLSHSCPAIAVVPTIVIDSAASSYQETWDETYSWTLDKSLDLAAGETAKAKFYDSGNPPEFVLQATRSDATTKSGWKIVDTTQVVSGKFTLTNATSANATITLSGATCTKGDDSNTSDLTFTYSCVFGTESSVSAANGLNGSPFSVGASVTTTGGNDSDTWNGSWGNQSGTSSVGNTYGRTASLTDDLAKFGGEVLTCTGCGTKDVDWGVDANQKLYVNPVDGSFTVTYSVAWDWTDYKTELECGVDFTNTAELSVFKTADDSSPSKSSDFYVSEPSCPPPSVTIDSVDSTYDITYDDVYDWAVTKTFDGQGEDFRASYTVSAERTGPEAGNIVIVEDSAIVNGDYSTEFADASNVVVTVTYGGNSYDCVETPDTASTGTYECTIAGLTTDDQVNGLDGSEFTVEAKVDTAGGTGTDSSTGSWSKPTSSIGTDVNATARIDDDLGGYGAYGVNCTIGAGNCETNADDEGVVNSGQLTSEPQSDSFSVSYTLDWDYSLDTDECPSIENNVDLIDGTDGENVYDSDSTNEQMDCPEPTITIDSVNSTYVQTWDERWGWSFDKQISSAGYEKGEKPEFVVTAERDASSTPENYSIVDDSQVISGTFTVINATSDEATISLTGADCTVSDTTPADTDSSDGLTYTYSCVVIDEPSVTGPDGRDGDEFTVDADVSIYGNEDRHSSGGTFGKQDASSAESNTYDASASITDNLATLGGSVISCVEGTDTECTATIDSNKVLTAGPTSSKITVTYAIDWDWTSKEDSEECEAGFENVASLLDSDGAEIDSVTLESTTDCPVPTVSIDSNSSTYDMSYDEVYSWSVTKEFLGQDEDTWRPSYKVTATRNEPTTDEEQVVKDSAVVSGSFSTEYADWSEVEVTVSYDGQKYECDEDEDYDFSCTISGVSSTDLVNGVDGEKYSVSATVTTPGGEGSDSEESTWGTPASTDSTPYFDETVIEDDLGGKSATVTSCTDLADAETCNARISDDVLTSDSTSTSITVTYELDWDYTAVDACGEEIENNAKVTSLLGAVAPGSSENDTAATSSVEVMDCPVIELEVSAAGTYGVEYDITYPWTLTKTLSDGSPTIDGDVLLYDYTVEAARGTGIESGDRLVEGSYVLSGSFTVTNADWTKVAVTVGSVTCDVPSDQDEDGTYEFTCELTSAPATIDAIATATTKVTADVAENWDEAKAEADASWTQEGESALDQEYDKSAYVTDDLAGLPGQVTSCPEEDCNASIDGTDGVLTSDTTESTIVVEYTVEWNWREKTILDDCSVTLTNLAELLNGDDDSSIATDSVDADADCPVPTVSIDSNSSTYDMSYDKVYSWSVTKEFLGQDEDTWRPSYKVTASRNEPTTDAEQVVKDSAVVSGSFSTEYADPSEVEITVTYDSKDYDCLVGDDFTYSCAIDGVSSTDLVNGVDGKKYSVSATVTTPGGEGSDSEDSTWGRPASTDSTPYFDETVIEDDLGGKSATVTSCTDLADAETCNAWISDGVLTSESTTTSITVTYELDWDYTAVDACGEEIENNAKVTSLLGAVAPGSSENDTAATTLLSTMKCPVIDLSVTAAGTYDLEHDITYDWTMTKSVDPNSLTIVNGAYQFKYSVLATRDAGTKSAERLVNGSFELSGSFTVKNADWKKVEVKMGTDTCAVPTNQSDDGTYEFTCQVPSAPAALSGMSSATTLVTAEVKENWDDDLDSSSAGWTASGPSSLANEYKSQAYIIDDLAGQGAKTNPAPNSGSSMKSTPSTSSTRLDYTITWNPATCPATLTNTAKLYDSAGDAWMKDKSYTQEIGCPTVSGLTIGYWGNKAGGSEVVKKLTTWKSRWPALSTLPNFRSDSEVRNYMTLANCSGTCETMFLAQSLASAMNVLKNASYAWQSVMFQGQCVRVDKLMSDVLSSADKSKWPTGAQRVAYKSIFDDLNNTRAKTCVVSTVTNING